MAKLGYVGFALDMYGKGVFGKDGDAKKRCFNGIQYKTLYNDETSYSSIIRMTSDAVLESQQKILADDEAFLLLKGDMFIGDMLMQAGDWQFAPKGTKHLPLTTSKEAVLFVRSAQNFLSCH